MYLIYSSSITIKMIFFPCNNFLIVSSLTLGTLGSPDTSTELLQVVHLRKNEYNNQFVFFVEMNKIVIKETPLKISQNDYYDQHDSQNDYYEQHDSQNDYYDQL